MRTKIVELLGWYGAAAIIGAYGLVSFTIIEPNSLIYQLLNLTGALGVAIVSLYKRAYQPGVLNIIWTLIALFALINILIT